MALLHIRTPSLAVIFRGEVFFSPKKYFFLLAIIFARLKFITSNLILWLQSIPNQQVFEDTPLLKIGEILQKY